MRAQIQNITTSGTFSLDGGQAPVFLNPADKMLWEDVFPGTTADKEITDGDTFEIAGTTLVALHTPGDPPARPACTSRNWTPCSPGTPYSTGGQGRPGAVIRGNNHAGPVRPTPSDIHTV
jgi:hypothetical protein